MLPTGEWARGQLKRITGKRAAGQQDTGHRDTEHRDTGQRVWGSSDSLQGRSHSTGAEMNSTLERGWGAAWGARVRLQLAGDQAPPLPPVLAPGAW